MPIRQVERAAETHEMSTNPSPSSVNEMPRAVPAPPRLISTTPANPMRQPRIFLLVKRSVRKIEAVKRIAMKFALDSMMELVVPNARDNPI